MIVDSAIALSNLLKIRLQIYHKSLTFASTFGQNFSGIFYKHV
ncbi:hypothetical protein HMPREF1981_03361 [Bacteroides pyogenes F0041]|uniref:Uncharacterized protein n=1 Tax=Bacteroides pyogenes F0041 TaxID=1321819 RepID=U2DN74_9BACE|nr:hypothetical protein HMPREF1981_03361 [Bacteroides pyogenes F0041]